MVSPAPPAGLPAPLALRASRRAVTPAASPESGIPAGSTRPPQADSGPRAQSPTRKARLRLGWARLTGKDRPWVERVTWGRQKKPGCGKAITATEREARDGSALTESRKETQPVSFRIHIPAAGGAGHSANEAAIRRCSTGFYFYFQFVTFPKKLCQSWLVETEENFIFSEESSPDPWQMNRPPISKTRETNSPRTSSRTNRDFSCFLTKMPAAPEGQFPLEGRLFSAKVAPAG